MFTYCTVPKPQEKPKGPIAETRATQGPGGSLGIYAKSSSTFGQIDPQTGEILPGAKVYNPAEVRLERFALQSAARSILPKSRTAKCLRCRQAHKPHVEVWRTAETKTTRYRNLQTCASVWACPVCAAVISERRSLELRQCIDQHQASGGQVLFLTVTNPHTRTDDLGEMLDAQSRAMSRFNGHRLARGIWADIGCIGTVRAWEVTHGLNGWHPHFHILIFCASGIDLEALRARLYSLWFTCCRLSGLPIPSEKHGLTLEDGSKAAEYVSKGLWGLDREMTKGHIKKARSGRSPFDLLRSYLSDRDKQAAALFQQFAHAFHGRRQLVYSKGLKSHFDLVEKTDAEISAQVEESAQLLGSITLDQWRTICRLDLRGDVLELARFGWSPVQRLLDQLPAKPPHINDS